MGPNERIGRESTDIYTRKGRFPSQFFNKKIDLKVKNRYAMVKDIHS